MYSKACNADPPPSTCTATGGAYYKLRHPLRAGGAKSFMVFFSPASEGAAPEASLARISAATERCSADAGVDGADMVTLVNCVKGAIPDARAVLCVEFGMVLRARTSNLFFENRATQYDDEQQLDSGPVKADGPMVSFVVLSA